MPQGSDYECGPNTAYAPRHCSGPCSTHISSLVQEKPEIQTDCEITSFLSVVIGIFKKDSKDKQNICRLDISVGCVGLWSQVGLKITSKDVG